MGIETRPVLVGPLTFLLIGKSVDGSDVLDLLPNLLSVYKEIFAALNKAGVQNLQIDEPSAKKKSSQTEVSTDKLFCFMAIKLLMKCETFFKSWVVKSMVLSNFWVRWINKLYKLYL